ncbi:HNH endonuclease signature motif containing protein [Cellulomonas fimi]|uniref:DUF222 domain-containing protein n=1 Tax=Cellulomonas fimi TaxID=1708 RepID=A0A7Y0M024_CELFI|nr:HNH endonuclease signature motif containing protein [Cellulomonas fimi]NMR21368.1 DUF222 domain-containing protein [Cellulomonas fimi]
MNIDADGTSGSRREGAGALGRSTVGGLVGEQVAAIAAAVETLAGVQARDLSSAQAVELFGVVHELADRLAAVAVQVLPVIEADGLWATSGARSFPAWVARRADVGVGRARRMTRLGRALRDELPATAAAVVAAGPERVSVEAAEILTSVAATSAARREVLADASHPCNEEFLVGQARVVGPDRLRVLARRWAAAADPDADDRGYKDAAEREFFDLAPTTGGCHLSGFLTVEHGQALVVALDAVTGVPAADDMRTSSQRRAAALHDLARITLDEGLAGAGAVVRPHLSVLVDYPTLLTVTGHPAPVPAPVPAPPPASPPARVGAAAEATVVAGTCAGHGATPDGPRLPRPAARPAPAVFEDGHPVPRAVLDKLLCDSEVTRIVFGPDSQLLDVGRTRRTYTGHLRRAIVARDQHCQYPTCHAPPRRCEAHHTEHWARDHGSTDATTGVLLCWHHHERVHEQGTEIRWRPDGGGWDFTDRHGLPLRQ